MPQCLAAQLILIARLKWFVMEAIATVGSYLKTTTICFVQTEYAERGRVDVTQIQNVKGHLSVELTTVLLEILVLGAAQDNVIITQTAQVENALLNTISAF